MALRIGLLILASCNLFNADLITVTTTPSVATKPVVSFPLNANRQDDTRDNQAPKLGENLQPLGYHAPKQQKTSGPQVVVVQERNQEHHCDSKKNQGKKQGTVVAVQHPVTVAVVEPVTRPSVIVTSTVIEENAVHPVPIKYDNDRINVNKTPVNFGTLIYVDYDVSSLPAKTPITVVTVPEISTAKPTEHKVGINQVINQSNIPSVNEYRNRLADQLLFSYNNLLNTRIKQIVDVPYPSKTPIPPPVRSELVRPGKLEHVVQKQLKVGEIYENAPIVIQKFLTTTDQRAIGYHQVHEHPVNYVVRRNP